MGTEWDAGISAGDRILLLSPRRDATVDRACLERIAGGRPRERNVLTVTYGRTADGFVEAWYQHVGVQPRNLGIVDVGAGTRSVEMGVESASRSRASNVVTSVADPSDLPSVMEAIDLFLDEWGPGGEAIVNFDSVTKLLYRVGIASLIAFLDELGDRLESRGSTGYFRLDKHGHDVRTRTILRPLFDSILELSVDREGWSWTRRSTAAMGLERNDEDIDGFSPGRAFDVLQPRQRRLVIHALRQADRPMRVSELVEWIMAQASDSETVETSTDTAGRLHAGLRHVHFPKLERNDIISVDSRGDTVELRDAARQVEPFLSLTAGEDLDE